MIDFGMGTSSDGIFNSADGTWTYFDPNTGERRGGLLFKLAL